MGLREENEDEIAARLQSVSSSLEAFFLPPLVHLAASTAQDRALVGLKSHMSSL